MKLVLDTNFLISRLCWNGETVRRAFDLALLHHEILYSVETVQELVNVLLRDKFDRFVSLAARERFIEELLAAATYVTIVSRIGKVLSCPRNLLPP